MRNSKPLPSSGYSIEGKRSRFIDRETAFLSVEEQGEEGLGLNPKIPDVKSLSPSQPSVDITSDSLPVTAAPLPLFVPSCHLKS